MKPSKKQSGRKTVRDSVSPQKPGKSSLLGVMVDSDFLAAVDAAAKKNGLSRSNFVRKAIADAIKASGGSISDFSTTAYRGQQTAPKAVVEQRAASARAVKLWKQSLPKRHSPIVVAAIVDAWDITARRISRKLRLDELEQCEREVAELMREQDERYRAFIADKS